MTSPNITKNDCPSVASVSSHTSATDDDWVDDATFSSSDGKSKSRLKEKLMDAALFVATVLFLPQHLHFVIAILIDMCFAFWRFQVSCLLRLGSSKEREDRDGKTKMTGHLPIPTFEIDSPDWTWDSLRNDYIKNGIPFILKPSKVSGPITTYCPPGFDEKTGKWADGVESEGFMEIRMLPLSTRVPGLYDEIFYKLLPFAAPPIPLVLAGNYNGADCHIDSNPNGTNCYLMMRGSKDVVIIPPHLSRKVPLIVGKDSLAVAGSIDNYKYLDQVEAYYRFTLEEGQLLFFHHSACLHHFARANDKSEATPIAMSFRLYNFYYDRGADLRVWLHNLFNPWTIWSHTEKAAKLFFFDDQVVLRPLEHY